VSNKFRGPSGGPPLGKKSRDWKVVDDVSGELIHASQSTVDYEGKIVKKGTADELNPQELAVSVVAEKQPPFARPDSPERTLESSDTLDTRITNNDFDFDKDSW